MRSFSITKRIALIIVVSAAALFGVGLTGLAQIQTEADSLQSLRDTSLKSVITLTDVRQEFTEARTFAYRLLILDGYRRETSKKDLAKRIAATQSSLKAYSKLSSGDKDKTMLKQDEDMINAYFKHLNDHILPILDESPEAAQRLLATQGTLLAQRANEAIESHVRFNRQEVEAATTASVASARRGRLIMETGIAIGLLIVAVLGVLLARDIRVRLNQLAAFLDRISETLDFTPRFKVSRKDEVGRAGQAANKLLGNLQQNLQSIANSAQSVAEAASRLTGASSQAAQAAEQQSEAAASVASTIEEMTVSINHVGDEALEADRLSKASEDLATEGEEVILQTAESINNIAQTVHSASSLISNLEGRSQKVAGVMTVIKEVAEQTNLLALNAAIEAARAGEQGRGFAVVADEVRKLAERTAHSTQEITQTVETMISMAAEASGQMNKVVDQVSSGVESAQAISLSIRRIGEGCHSAVGTVGEIANAIREQGSATNNIAAQVEKIAQMSEESSASAVESSAAASHLDMLAGDMLQVIRAYRLA